LSRNYLKGYRLTAAADRSMSSGCRTITRRLVVAVGIADCNGASLLHHPSCYTDRADGRCGLVSDYLVYRLDGWSRYYRTYAHSSYIPTDNEKQNSFYLLRFTLRGGQFDARIKGIKYKIPNNIVCYFILLQCYYIAAAALFCFISAIPLRSHFLSSIYYYALFALLWCPR